MASPSLNSSLRRSTRQSGPQSVDAQSVDSKTVDPNFNPFAMSTQTPFLTLINTSVNNGASAGQIGTFTEKRFQALCDEQRDGVTVKQACGQVKSPADEVIALFSPHGDRNFELANEVNQWVEFLNEENQWIFTTRSQDKSGSWCYHDRPATEEEVFKFTQKGWPYHR